MRKDAEVNLKKSQEVLQASLNTSRGEEAALRSQLSLANLKLASLEKDLTELVEEQLSVSKGFQNIDWLHF